MSSNADVIAALERAKIALQRQLNETSDQTTADELHDAIECISDEVMAVETKNLADSTYVPGTGPFQKATADGKAFIAKLKNLQNTFAAIEAVASAIDQVLKLVTKLGL